MGDNFGPSITQSNEWPYLCSNNFPDQGGYGQDRFTSEKG